MKKLSKLVLGLVSQWANTFYIASTAYIKNKLIIGNRFAIGQKNYFEKKIEVDQHQHIGTTSR
jgi:hypothetical protein